MTYINFTSGKLSDSQLRTSTNVIITARANSASYPERDRKMSSSSSSISSISSRPSES